MANNLLQQVQQLKLLIDQAKQQQTDPEALVEVMRAQFEKEKTEACHSFLL